MKTYNLTINKTDLAIEIRLPTAILKDLVLRSEENGQAIELEISIRLARSLERDLKMIEADNDFALLAFNRVSHINNIQFKEQK